MFEERGESTWVRPAFVIRRSSLLRARAMGTRCGVNVTRSRLLRAGSATSALMFWVLAGLAGPALADSASPTASASASPSAASSADTVGQSVVTFGLGPSTKGKIDRRANFTMLAARGGVVSDEMAVVNLTYSQVSLNIYAADATNGPDGSVGLEPSYGPKKDSASWVTFNTPTGKGYIVLQPRETAYIPFTVRVPQDAYVGDHLAGVVAALVTQGQTPGQAGSPGTDVTLEQRVALRLNLRVAGELQAGLEIEGLSASFAAPLSPFEPGVATISYTVKNTGNVRLGDRQEVSVRGVTGPTVFAQGLKDVPMLLPGNTAKVRVSIPGVSPFVFDTASVTVVALAVAGDANPPSEVASASTHFAAVPWTLFAVVLGLGLVAAGLIRIRRPLPSVAGQTQVPTGAHAAIDLVSSGAQTSEGS